MKKPKTKKYIEFLHNLTFTQDKTLFVLAKADESIVLSSKNVKKAKVMLVEHLNTYDLLVAKKLLISECAVALLSKKVLAS